VIFAPDQGVEIRAALESALFHDGAPILVRESGSKREVGLQVPTGIALVVATSGSSGTPKYVLHSPKSLLASARATHHFLDAQEGESWALRLPLTHIAGLMVMVRSILLKSPLTDSGEYQSIVPTQLFRALQGDAFFSELKLAKAVLVGGGPSEKILIEEARNSGVNVVTTYGMSETAGGCVYNGIPLPGVSITITDEGRVFIKAPQLALGYLDESPGFQDGGFLTQDLGRWSDQEKLEIIGRADEVIISGGIKIALGEVESRIKEMPQLRDVHLFTRVSAEWGEEIVCAAVTREHISLKEIREFVAEVMPRDSAPRALIVLQEMPLRGIGKPDRDTLRGLPTTEGL
jgi:O-succinylbenzoic acid--CoA ligase